MNNLDARLEDLRRNPCCQGCKRLALEAISDAVSRELITREEAERLKWKAWPLE